ncbi:gliding motility-associated C-terminal domain-containing protein [Mucilaginibacter lutimaris]|uniref:Gliding motility-associated C-terminal domain-containing protein n=1 Tax=Mucilaginibacter lutimaris TaxID=931629 RepID=A0ABW2ZF81_9SPHI
MHLFKAKPILVILSLWLYAFPVYAQNQNNNWYFGNFGGLDFNQLPVKAVTNGKLRTSEACGSISDIDGNLLFYTDGITVWDKQHNVMNNGTGLSGNVSSAQLVITPAPENDNIYYIFTAGVYGNEHLDYSIVDMTLNGGLGGVTVKNSRLLSQQSSEKMVAIKHGNGKDIWLIGHATGSDMFYAWPVTKNGVGAPVTSFAGTSYIGLPGANTIGIGVFKASPDGTMIATGGINQAGGFLELLNFNANTGIITTGAQKITGFASGVLPYGIEFSPNGQLLYLSEYNFFNPANLYQIKLPFATSNIATSSTKLATISKLGAVQIATNGKIYISESDIGSLHAINSPDLQGVGCNLQLNAINLNGSTTQLGLPAGNLSTFTGFEFRVTGVCASMPTQFKLRTSLSSLSNITWDFGDPASGVNNSSTQQDPVHQFSQAGTYNVKLSALAGGNPVSYNADVTILQTPVGVIHDVSEKVVLCNIGSAALSAHGATGSQTYNWYDADKILLIKNTSGNYQTEILDHSATFYVAIANTGCEGELKQIDVIYDKAVAVIHTTTTVVEQGATVILTANDAVKYEWSPAIYLSSTDTKSVSATPMSNITYTLKITNANGCTDETTIALKLKSDLVIPNTFTPNNDGINDTWVVKNLDIQDNTLQIFNRNGKMVFNARNYANTWNGTYNGKQLPAGVYYYIINLYNQFISGSVTILR